MGQYQRESIRRNTAAFECDRSHAIAVTVENSSDGSVVYEVSGDTEKFHQVLSELGGRWDKQRQVWSFYDRDPRPELATLFTSTPVPIAAAVKDAASSLGTRGQLCRHQQHLRKQRLLETDDSALSDENVLELLLTSDDEWGKGANLAKQLLARFGSLGGVVDATPEQLAQFEGADQARMGLLKTGRAVASHLARDVVVERPAFETWTRLIAYLKVAVAQSHAEHFRLLFLDRRNVLIADETHDGHAIQRSSAYPREVVKRALALDASAVVMVHHHPTSHPLPSKSTIKLTAEVRDVLQGVGIILHDHIIVSKRGHTSFRQMGLIGR